MQSKVSILIPVYNRQNIIAETIKSAVSQSHENLEVIIVDNASTDNTWAIVTNFAKHDLRIKAFRNERNLGPVKNWVRCVQEASGEYGKILWSDDLISSDFIEKTLPLFSSDVSFVYTGVKVFDEEKNYRPKPKYLLKKTGIYPTSLYIKKAISDRDVPVSPGCAIFRMEDIQKNLWLNIPNKINSDFSMHAIGNDLLLFLLTAKDYKYFGHVAETLSFFRSHEGSISTSSSDGKLPLHYSISKAFFVENFYPSIKGELAAKIQGILWIYKDSIKFNIRSINDFFEIPGKISRILIIKEVSRNLFRLQISMLRNFFKI